jgi:hypothetical protein
VGGGEIGPAAAPDPDRRHDPDSHASAGGIYYWPDPATFVVYYNDLGQSVPPPGLIRLGTTGASLVQIADAGGQCTVEIDRVP